MERKNKNNNNKKTPNHKKPQGLETEAREIQTGNRFLSVELISLWNTFSKRGGESPDPSYVFSGGLNAIVVLATYCLLGSQGTQGEVLLPLSPQGQTR